MVDISDLVNGRYELYTCSIKEIKTAIETLSVPIQEQIKCREYVIGDFMSHFRVDVLRGTYKKLRVDDIEKTRVKILEEIDQEEDILDKIEMLLKTAREIEEYVIFFSYNRLLKRCCRELFTVEVCRNMMTSGVSLTEICKYVPKTKMGDLFRMAKEFFGIDLVISEEERRQIEEFKKQDKESNKIELNVQELVEKLSNHDEQSTAGGKKKRIIVEKETTDLLNECLHLKLDVSTMESDGGDVCKALMDWVKEEREQGIEQGRVLMLVSLMKEGCITKELAASKMGVGLDEFERMVLTVTDK